MTTSGRWQRIAELVASHLRERIVSGELPDGSLLPKESELRLSYPVSKPSFREAMRILEAEGLITVRRGNVGGAVVHRPSATNVAYSLALVLAADRATMSDVAQSLRECEPACAALCAERSDRKRLVVPRLQAIHEQAMAHVDEVEEVIAQSRKFHEALVQLCGSPSLIVIVGALETIWSSHEQGWARQDERAESIPLEERRSALEVHAEMIDLISAGESEAVRDLAAHHLERAVSYPHAAPDSTVDPVLVRDQLGSRPPIFSITST